MDTKILCYQIGLQYDMNHQPILTLSTKGDIKQKVQELQQITTKGKELVVEIKQYRKKRSLDANAYMWVLCDEIAKVIRATSEEVYRKAIRDAGASKIMPIIKEGVEKWIDIWSSNGIGWFVEILGDSKFTGYVNVKSYYGSSAYDTAEMARLIDYIVQDAKELGIETMTPAELARLKENWRG